MNWLNSKNLKKLLGFLDKSFLRFKVESYIFRDPTLSGNEVLKISWSNNESLDYEYWPTYLTSTTSLEGQFENIVKEIYNRNVPGR